MPRVPGIRDPEVAATYAAVPPKPRRKLLALRKLILETAARTDGVGPLEETLKWGEPAYLTSESRSGSTVRIAWKPSAPDEVAVHFHCQTRLVPTFRELYADRFRFDGNRSIVFHVDDAVPTRPLAQCIEMALTYHRIKRDLGA